MENWGLVTYRETALLGSLNSSSASELSRISIVVAHELAHQCAPQQAGRPRARLTPPPLSPGGSATS